MEFSLIADTVTVCTAKQGIAFGKSLLQRLDLANHISFADSVVDHQSPGGGIVQASAIIFPVDAIAPPPVRSSSYKTIPGSVKSDEPGEFRLVEMEMTQEILVVFC
uniref:AT3g06780/F3E22_8 n=1 Tax=Arabidopsis thaliana TaxID=3702 RepID=Q941C0_ARATH|nr:AT3g06780/F3E22_8 [Arabidopsis thaliana]AAL31247.1 AT3g06780/F3E22_8 [Arabidopsis thaliana]